MLIRPAASFLSLDESMKNVSEVHSVVELEDYIEKNYEGVYNLDTLKCRFYCDDSRIGWHTYLITADFTDGTYKQQAILFADGPMEDLPAVVINAPLSIEPPKRRFILVKECDGKSSYLDADKKWKPSPFQKIEDCTVFTCSLLEAREKAFLAMSLVTDPNEKPRIYPVELINSANEEGGMDQRKQGTLQDCSDISFIHRKGQPRMNLTEKYPRITPEAIKPVRHHTDWGTRLMFHPDLFPKYKGTRYDVLDETDTLHTGVLWENDGFQAPFPQRHPIIKAWSPSTVVIHGYELNEFYKWCEQFIKANSINLIGTLTDALTAFHAYKHRSSRSDLLAALSKIEHRTEAEEALYESLCNNGETVKTYTGDANKLFNDILNAYKDILVGNIYCLEMGKYLHVMDVFGKWIVASDGDAGIYLKCKRLTYQAFGNSSAYPCCENTEMCFTMSVCELAKKVAAGGDPVGIYAKPVAESTVTAELDKMEKAFTTNMKTVREYVAKVYGRKEA